MDLETTTSKDVSSASAAAPSASSIALRGSVLVLIQFDVAEEIRLDPLRELLGAQRLQQPKMKQGVPGYVRYQRPPVVEGIEPLVLETGERLDAHLKYYDYGVLSVVLELPFAGDWETLVRLASQWVWDVDFSGKARSRAEEKLKGAQAALVKPYSEWLSEDYYIFHVREITGSPSGSEMVARYGGRIPQIVRGEELPLSDNERDEILKSTISYYTNDATVIGYNAAFVYDSAAGAETAIQLLEYANSQLLEFRHYDELLTRELERVYAFLDQGTSLLGRWRLAKTATRLHTVLLEIGELAEHADNAIKFLSDMFEARLYKMAALKVGVPDYKDLVNQKIHTAEELYRFMVDEFNQSRAFVLEVMVVVILIIELIYAFHGKLF